MPRSPHPLLLRSRMRCLDVSMADWRFQFFAFSPHFSQEDTRESRYLPYPYSLYYLLTTCMLASGNMYNQYQSDSFIPYWTMYNLAGIAYSPDRTMFCSIQSDLTCPVRAWP